MFGLIERDRELAALTDALASTEAGAGKIVLIEGEPGIGKSRLVMAACELARQRGFLVLAAEGADGAAGISYEVVRQLFEPRLAQATPQERRALLAGAARLAGEVVTPDPGPRTTAEPTTGVDHGLYWLASNLADRHAVLVAVDDAQWADRASLRFLLYLCRRLEGMRVLVVLAARADARAAGGELLARLAELAQESPHVEVRPPALTLDGTCRLLAGLAVTPSPELVSACHKATSGNPFLLTELAGLIAAGGPRTPDPVAIERLTPPAVNRAIGRRLDRLPAACRPLCHALAILGDGAELRLVAALAGADGGTSLDAAGELVAAAIWSCHDRPRFAHSIVRGAVAAELSPARVAELHGAAADLLAAEGADAERIATHLAATPPNGHADIVDTLRAAAGKARTRGTLEFALGWLRRALDEPPAAHQRGALLAELGEVELLAGDPQRAVEHLRLSHAMAGTPAERAVRALALASAAAAMNGIPEAASVLMDSATELDVAERELSLRVLGILAALTRFYLPTEPWIERRMADALHYTGTTAGERLVLAMLALRRLIAGDADTAEVASLARRAHAGGALLRDLTADDAVSFIPALCLTYADEPHAAFAMTSGGFDDARARGSLVANCATNGLWSMIARQHGDVASAESHGRAAWDAATELGRRGHPVIALIAARQYSAALVERGEFGTSGAVLDWLADHHGIGLPGETGAYLHHARAVHELATGHPERARDELLLAAEQSGSGWDPDRPWRAQLALAHAALGATTEAVTLADAHLDGARRWSAASAVGAALRVRALVDPAGPAIPMLESAVETLSGSPARLEHARALVDLGSVLLAAGRRADAVERLRAGRDLSRRCGARHLEQRADEALCRAGSRQRRTMFAGVEALTAGERRVVDYAIRGAPNREIAQGLFVTTKTVEAHLASAYRKLRISSRAELRTLMADLDRTTDHTVTGTCRFCMAG